MVSAFEAENEWSDKAHRLTQEQSPTKKKKYCSLRETDTESLDTKFFCMRQVLRNQKSIFTTRPETFSVPNTIGRKQYRHKQKKFH